MRYLISLTRLLFIAEEQSWLLNRINSLLLRRSLYIYRRCCVACSCSEPVSALGVSWMPSSFSPPLAPDTFWDAENVCVSHVTRAGLLSELAPVRAAPEMDECSERILLVPHCLDQSEARVCVHWPIRGQECSCKSPLPSRCNNQGCVKLRAKIASLCIVQCGMKRGSIWLGESEFQLFTFGIVCGIKFWPNSWDRLANIAKKNCDFFKLS